MLTIGMPIFNSARTVARAIRSIQAQTFTDFRMIISDNASDHSTQEIVSNFSKHDPRIEVRRQPTNIGASNNFVQLANLAETPYFMWAAGDDEWSPNYVEACLLLLSRGAGFAGGQIINVDDSGSVLRRYTPFSRFSSPSSTVRVAQFALAREADGKANMIYSLFRTPLLQSVARTADLTGPWGSDMGLVSRALAIAQYKQAPEATLYKHVTSADDVATSLALAAGRYGSLEFDGNFPPNRTIEYYRSLSAGVPPSGKLSIAAVIAMRRIGLIGWQVKQKIRNLRRRATGA